jgi:uncharacterized MAPEG superfamily protein
MATLIICLFIAVLLPYVAKVPMVYAIRREGTYDNHHPRAQQASLKGFGARAVAAHQNSFESLILFSTAVLTALATHHVTKGVQIIAVIYIVSRLLYNIFYVMDWAALRSLIWFISVFSSLSILWSCLP